MSDELQWVRLKLHQWGRWSRFRGLGFPSMSTTEKARIGRGGMWDGPTLPEDVEAVDLAVARSLPQHKLILVEHYTKGGSVRDHAARLTLTRMTYWRRKHRAEQHVGILLQCVGRPVYKRG